MRPHHEWWILFPSRKQPVCLQMLAFRHGYRICEICADLDCCERYLYEVFVRDIGLPPKVWMRRERMVVARRMLVGGRSPEYISDKLGFTSKHNFRREFLAFYQVPPLQFQTERWCLDKLQPALRTG